MRWDAPTACFSMRPGVVSKPRVLGTRWSASKARVLPHRLRELASMRIRGGLSATLANKVLSAIGESRARDLGCGSIWATSCSLRRVGEFRAQLSYDVARAVVRAMACRVRRAATSVGGPGKNRALQSIARHLAGQVPRPGGVAVRADGPRWRGPAVTAGGCTARRCPRFPSSS